MKFNLSRSAIEPILPIILPAILKGEYNELGFELIENILNNKQIMSDINNVLFRFGFELSPVVHHLDSNLEIPDYSNLHKDVKPLL